MLRLFNVRACCRFAVPAMLQWNLNDLREKRKHGERFRRYVFSLSVLWAFIRGSGLFLIAKLPDFKYIYIYMCIYVCLVKSRI